MSKALPVTIKLEGKRVWSPEDPILGTRCWLWSGCKKPVKQGSYPMIHHPETHKPVHAVALALKVYRDIDPPKRGDGLEISHICETGSKCWNPWHVCLENHKENLDRRPRELVLAAITKAQAARRAKYPRQHATCHPELFQKAKGLCKACYTVALWKSYYSKYKAEICARSRARYQEMKRSSSTT